MRYNIDKCKVLPSGRRQQIHKGELLNNWLDGVSKESKATVIRNLICIIHLRGVKKNRDYSFYLSFAGLLLCFEHYTLRNAQTSLEDYRGEKQDISEVQSIWFVNKCEWIAILLQRDKRC